MARICTECEANREGLTSCDCPYGTYEVAGEAFCPDCVLPCETCVEDPEACEICADGYENPPDCTPIPPTAQSAKIGEVPVGSAKVFACSDECQTCSGTASNCVDCAENRDGPGCPCIDGYFEEEIDGVRVCTECSYKCVTCSSIDFCDECDGDRINPSDCICPPGTWDNGVDTECQTCDYNICKECEGSATTCTVCADGRSPPDECPCLPGTYDDLTDDVGTCFECNYPCDSCIDWDTCTSCSDIENRVMDENGECQCKDGYYDAGVAYCEKCNFKCETCNDGSCCTECAGNRLDAETCCTTCPEGYYDDGTNVDCALCTDKYGANCVVCDEDSCTECGENREAPGCNCITGYVEVNGKCEPCDYNCETCAVTTSACTECLEPRVQ